MRDYNDSIRAWISTSTTLQQQVKQEAMSGSEYAC